MTAKTYDPNDMINRPNLPQEWVDRLVVGRTPVLNAIGDLVERGVRAKRHGTCRIAIDSHLKVPWSGCGAIKLGPRNSFEAALYIDLSR